MRARRIRSTVYGVFLAFASAFVLWSAKLLIWPLFGLDTPAERRAAPAGVACAEQIRSLVRALDRAMAAASASRGQAEASAMFRAALSPEWDGEESSRRACAADPNGLDAYAALMRLRRAEEGFVERQVVEIDPLRREVQAHLPR
jgi:hypothetical protein